jgi:hypothetical protein
MNVKSVIFNLLAASDSPIGEDTELLDDSSMADNWEDEGTDEVSVFASELSDTENDKGFFLERKDILSPVSPS